MTDPQTQAQADAEQVRLVLEALALRRDCRGDAAPGPPVVRFLPGGPRPSLAEGTPATVTPPGPPLFSRARRPARGREDGKPALR